MMDRQSKSYCNLMGNGLWIASGAWGRAQRAAQAMLLCMRFMHYWKEFQFKGTRVWWQEKVIFKNPKSSKYRCPCCVQFELQSTVQTN